MKPILKILVLGAVLILGTTAVVDQGLAADKGSQLIFHANMAHTSFISVLNANPDEAVTVLVQYYNNELDPVLWYLRVIAPSTNVLVNAFNHMIPGPDETNAGDAIMASGKTGNGHFVIAVTAVGANVEADNTADATDNATLNDQPTVNVLFPDFLAEGMHKTGNIDECGVLWAIAPADDGATPPVVTQNPLMYTKNPAADEDDCADGDASSKNVGGLTINNAEPIAFNHLTGHFTEALVGTDAGGGDQTASWGGTPIVRPAVENQNNAMVNINDYQTLNGMNTDATGTAPAGGRLAEKDAGGIEVDVHGATGYTVEGFRNIGANHDPDTTAQTETEAETGAPSPAAGKIHNGLRRIRGLNDGALVLPALHGGGAETKQIMLLLSAADDFGDPARGKGGDYMLIPAMTGYMVTPMDQMGNPLDMKDPADDPKFGSGGEGESGADPSAAIIVNGISVMTNADLGKCTGTAIDGPWTLSHLTDLVPAASSGGKDFAGLDAMIDPTMNASPGWVKFGRMAVKCMEDYGDGDSAHSSTIEDPDGIPTTDERTYTAGTLIVEEKSQARAFVTTGQALLKFITSDSTFAASWTLKSPDPASADDFDLSN